MFGAESDDTDIATGFGSGLVGGILDAAIGPVMANVQKGWSSKAARRARQWAEYMASTQFVRTRADMEAAGLNPILAVTRGPGGVPSGPTAATPRHPDSDVSGGLSRGIASAVQLKTLNANMKILNEQAIKAKNEADASKEATRFINSQIGEILARQGLLDEQMRSQAATTKNIEQSTRESASRTALNAAARPGAEAEARLYETEQGEAVKQLAPVIRLLRDILGASQGR